MGMMTNSLLEKHQPPPSSEKRQLLRNGTTYEVLVTTSRLTDAPYHLYSVFYEGEMLLQWISNPGREDILDAIQRRRKESK